MKERQIKFREKYSDFVSNVGSYKFKERLLIDLGIMTVVKLMYVFACSNYSKISLRRSLSNCATATSDE